ncbi:MAG: TetR/AcrR family transcriptional regulator [Gemmatimonadales bacterium]|jgi:AcrR family transcriptional regulator
MKQHHDPRERLIEAARQLFASAGFDATSVRDITSRAHTNLGAITYHFGSKEALYHAVIERFATPIADRIAAISGEAGPPLERLTRCVRAFLEHIWRHPEMPRLIMREMASDRPLPEPVARVIRRNIESFGRIIVEGQADGSIRRGEPHLLALSVGGQPLFLTLASKAIRHALGKDPSDPSIRELVAETVLTNMRGALAAAAPAAAAPREAGVLGAAMPAAGTPTPASGVTP